MVMRNNAEHMVTQQNGKCKAFFIIFRAMKKKKTAFPPPPDVV